MVTSEEIEMLKYPLKHYLKDSVVKLCNFETVITNREEVEEGIYEYKCPLQTVWLNEEGYAVTYGNQYVIDDEYYYDFNTYSTEIDLAGTYEYINTLEWKNNSAIKDV